MRSTCFNSVLVNNKRFTFALPLELQIQIFCIRKGGSTKGVRISVCPDSDSGVIRTRVPVSSGQAKPSLV